MNDVTETPSFRIDPVNLCLWRSGAEGVEERLNLTPKTFDVLRYLAENPGRLVSHGELLAAIWHGVHVQPEVLKSHILAIRNALGDKSSSPRFIETQRGRGYRLIGKMDGLAPLAHKPEAAVDLGVFAGRAEPLQELLALFQRATLGEPQAVFISGEPGIGKTTLIAQFLNQVRGHPDLVVAEGHCIEGFAGAEPYYPILETLRQLCKSTDRTGFVRSLLTVAPSWALQMPAQIPAHQWIALRQQVIPGARRRMVREACDFFEALATERPLVLFIEDLHWADFATIDFLSALCRRRSSAKLLLIGTYRPEDLKTARHPLKEMAHDLALHNYCREIELAPLSIDAIAEVLTGGAEGQAASSEFTQFIRERTCGNPLFMRVTLEYLFQRGNIVRKAHGWQPLAPFNQLASVTPPTLRRAIESKIDGLTDDQRKVLEAASVAGLRLDPATTANASGIDEQSFESICEEFSRNSYIIHRDKLLVLPNGDLVCAYAFNHAMYREVLYDRIGQSRRAYLHRTIAERLEEIYPPDQRNDLAVRLAEHFAGAREWPRAIAYLRSALRVATIRFARRDALAILDHASELAANLPENGRTAAEIELLERRGTIQASTHDPMARETYAKFAEKAAQCGDIDAQCRALIGLAYVTSWHDLTRSLQLLNEVLALCEKLADPIQRDVTRLSAYVRRLWGFGWNRVDAHECEKAFARLKNDANSISIARAQISFSMMCMLSTRYRETHDLVHDSYGVLCESPQSMVEIDLARAVWMHHVGVPWSLFSLGEFGTALTGFNASIAAFEENSDPGSVISFQVYRGVLLFHILDFEGVLRNCEPAVHSFTVDDASAARILPLERRIARIFCGLAEVGLGHNTAALDHFRAAEGAMEHQPTHLDWYWRLPLEWGMVGLLISEGDGPAMLARAKRLCELTEQTDERTWQALAWESRARAALSCGKTADAVDYATKALAACKGVEVPLAEWRVHATSAVAYKAVGDIRRTKRHTRLGAAVRTRLAESLPEGDPLRLKFERRGASLSAV